VLVSERGVEGEWAPVEGTITRAGQPLAGVRMTFVPDRGAGTLGPRSAGITDAAGHYQLRSDAGHLGAIVGHHRVQVLDLNAVQLAREKRAERIKLRHQDSKKKPQQPEEKSAPEEFHETPIGNVEIHSGLQTIDFQLP
jgi:hypothetical protein